MDKATLKSAYTTQGLILASHTVYTSILPDRGFDVHDRSLPVEQFGGECCKKELSMLAETIRRKQVDVLVGMGDALSTWFEAQSCSVTQSRNECGGLGTLTERRSAGRSGWLRYIHSVKKQACLRPSRTLELMILTVKNYVQYSERN